MELLIEVLFAMYCRLFPSGISSRLQVLHAVLFIVGQTLVTERHAVESACGIKEPRRDWNGFIRCLSVPMRPFPPRVFGDGIGCKLALPSFTAAHHLLL